MTQYYPVYFVTGATLADGELLLSINGAPTIADHTKFVIRFAPNVQVPSGVTASTPVYVVVNGTNYQVFDRFAEPCTHSEIPLGINNSYYNCRFAIVGGMGVKDNTYYYVAWNLPTPRKVIE